MKTLIIALVLTLTSFSAKAYDTDLCGNLAGFAEQAMTWRQQNSDITQILAVNAKTAESFGNSEKAEILKALMNLLTIKAYKTPLFSTNENKARAVIEYKNNFFVECLTM